MSYNEICCTVFSKKWELGNHPTPIISYHNSLIDLSRLKVITHVS